jgi:hypothetical protein
MEEQEFQDVALYVAIMPESGSVLIFTDKRMEHNYCELTSAAYPDLTSAVHTFSHSFSHIHLAKQANCTRGQAISGGRSAASESTREPS